MWVDGDNPRVKRHTCILWEEVQAVQDTPRGKWSVLSLPVPLDLFPKPVLTLLSLYEKKTSPGYNVQSTCGSCRWRLPLTLTRNAQVRVWLGRALTGQACARPRFQALHILPQRGSAHRHPHSNPRPSETSFLTLVSCPKGQPSSQAWVPRKPKVCPTPIKGKTPSMVF